MDASYVSKPSCLQDLPRSSFKMAELRTRLITLRYVLGLPGLQLLCEPADHLLFDCSSDSIVLRQTPPPSVSSRDISRCNKMRIAI